MNEQTRTELIESRIDPVKTGAMSLTSMGLAFRDMGEVMNFAKLMAVSGPAVREVFRGNPGACLAVTLQAISLGFEPFAFARKCYMVNGEIAYEAQLINGIILSRAPFTKRPDMEFSGEGQSRRCKVTFYFQNDDKKVYESPPLAGITPKNSPLWKSDPDQQLAYYSTRAAARRYCPDVILGMYDPEEMASALAKDITPPKAPVAEMLAKGERPKVSYVDPGPMLEQDIHTELHGQTSTMPVEAPAEAKDGHPASEPSSGLTEASPTAPESPQGSQTQETQHDDAQVSEAQAKPKSPEPDQVAPNPAEADRTTLNVEENGLLYDLGVELAGVSTAADLHIVQELWEKTVQKGSAAFKKAVAEKYKNKVEKLGKGKRK